jgi:hypothetical protein
MVTWLGRINVNTITARTTFLNGNSKRASPYPIMAQEIKLQRVGTPARMILLPRDAQKSILFAACA